MQVTHHYQHYQHGHQHIAIRGVSTLVPPSGKKARRALGLVPSRRIVDASLLRASLRPRRRRQRRDPLPPVVSATFSSLLSPPLTPFCPSSHSRSYPFARKSLSAVLGTPRDLLAIRLIGKRGRPPGLQERRFPSPKGMCYREKETRQRRPDGAPDGISGERTRIAGRKSTHCVPWRRHVFQLRRDALSAACSGLVN